MRHVVLRGGDEGATYALIFDSGDEVVSGLTRFAEQQGVAAAHFTAIGAFSEATVGFFELERKEYRPLRVAEQVEVLSLAGNIALDEQQAPRVHAHVVLGKSDGSTRGGHLLDARVRPTLEVVLVESPPHLRRRHDPAVGLALIEPGAARPYND
jgi:predicted DNA-binding protein with PD1-like motif